MRSTRHALWTVVVGSGILAIATAQGQAAAHAAQLDDPTIVAIFDAANTWDIEASTLGAARSKNPEVVKLAHMFTHDHETVRQQGRDLAKKLGVVPTPPHDFALQGEHVNAMAKLREADGAHFDRAYLENEVAYHKAVIDAMNTTLLPAIQNAELKALVVKVAPAFQAHMIAAQTLLNKLPA